MLVNACVLDVRMRARGPCKGNEFLRHESFPCTLPPQRRITCAEGVIAVRPLYICERTAHPAPTGNRRQYYATTTTVYIPYGRTVDEKRPMTSNDARTSKGYRISYAYDNIYYISLNVGRPRMIFPPEACLR